MNNIIYIPVKIEDELPTHPINMVIVGGKIPMMAQLHPDGKWFSMGMSEAKEIEKGITHWLKPVSKKEYLTKVIEDAWEEAYKTYSLSKEEYIKKVVEE